MHHRDLDRDEADGVAVGRRLGDRSWPTTPEPPVRLTTLNGCLSSFSSRVPMMRAVASVPPPAPQGTMS